MRTDPEEDYARGWVPFLGVEISLSSRPLIPRTETEYWVHNTIETLNRTEATLPRPLRVLDMFAGSGCIGIAVLAHLSQTVVTFADINPTHSNAIRTSLVRNTIDEIRASFVVSDVWDAIPGMFDVVLANPPYLSQKRNTADPSVTHEPEEALYADDDGYALIEKTITGLQAHLAPGGQMWIEHEPFHTERIPLTASRFGFAVRTANDQYGVARYSVITSHL